MTRKQSIEYIRVALLKGDMRTANRIYVESRISRAVYAAMYRKYYKRAA